MRDRGQHFRLRDRENGDFLLIRRDNGFSFVTNMAVYPICTTLGLLLVFFEKNICCWALFSCTPMGSPKQSPHRYPSAFRLSQHPRTTTISGKCGPEIKFLRHPNEPEPSMHPTISCPPTLHAIWRGVMFPSVKALQSAPCLEYNTFVKNRTTSTKSFIRKRNEPRHTKS